MDDTLPAAASPVDAQPPAPVPIEVRAGTAEAATFEALLGKERRRGEFRVFNPGGNTLVVTAEALNYGDYDRLMESCPPTDKQRIDGAAFDLRKFGPRLLAACLTQPSLSVEEAERLWNAPNWAGGEIVDLWRKVNDLCQRGIDVPFTAPG